MVLCWSCTCVGIQWAYIYGWLLLNSSVIPACRPSSATCTSPMVVLYRACVTAGGSTVRDAEAAPENHFLVSKFPSSSSPPCPPPASRRWRLKGRRLWSAGHHPEWPGHRTCRPCGGWQLRPWACDGATKVAWFQDAQGWTQSKKRVLRHHYTTP